jgi:hypothetical protein
MLNFKKFEYRLPDSPSFSFNIQKPTPRLADSESQRLPTSRVGESLTTSFFDYKYLREFEAKSRTARKVV